MSAREEIPASVELPSTPVRRMGAADKARQMMTPEKEAPAALSTFTKLTTRIPPDQLDWLKGEVKRYRAEHPRAPKITIEELIRVAIDSLKEAKNLDALIAKHRV